MCDDIVYIFDGYIKKCIFNSVKRFAKNELIKSKKEISLDSLFEKSNSKETAILPEIGSLAVFDFLEENFKNIKLEDYFSEEKYIKALKVISEDERNILKLNIVYQYTSEDIGKIYNKSATNIRVIIYNAKNKIIKKYKGDV